MTRWTRQVVAVSGWVLALGGALGGRAHAQETLAPVAEPVGVESGGVRASLGFGVAILADTEDTGMAVRGGLAFPFGSASLLTVRASLAEELALFTIPAISIWDVGVMYGRQAKGKSGYGAISAGLALTGGMKRGPRVSKPAQCGFFLDCLGLLFTPVEYEKRPFTTVGIPFEAEAGFTFSSAFGLGVNVSGNLNQRMSTVGASLALLIGDLR